MNDGKEWNEVPETWPETDSMADWEKKMIEEQEALFRECLELDPLREQEESPFREYEKRILAGGLIMERFSRGDEPAEPERIISPSEYTSAEYQTSGGIHCPGQIVLERLSKETLRNMSGDPVHDIPLWQHQSEPYSCVASCESFVLRSEGNPEITEAQLIREGIEKEIYDPERGILLKDIGKLAESHGMIRECIQNSSLEQIENIQNDGGKVIALVSGGKMAYPNQFGFFRADHAVQVVSIDRNDPKDVRVILNDPGREDGQGISVPTDIFLRAWRTGKNTIIALYGNE